MAYGALVSMTLAAFAGALAAAGPSGLVTSGSAGGLRNAAAHLIDLQCGDGGWGRPHASCPAALHEDTAPVAMGLLGAFARTGYAPYDEAARAAGAFELTNEFGNSEARFAPLTPYFLWKLSAATGDPAYADHAATAFFDALAAGTYGPADQTTADWIGAVEAARSGAEINLRPWEFQTAGAAADAIGQAGQLPLFTAAILDGLATLDNTDPGGVPLDLLGLAGGIRGLALNDATFFAPISSPNNPLIDGKWTLCQLADALVAQQNEDGSWYRHSNLASPSESDKDTETTAYAVLALQAVVEATTCVPYEPAIRDARSWLAGIQDVDGGYPDAPGGVHRTPVEGAVVNALTASGASMILETAECPNDIDPQVGFQLAVELWMRDLAYDATGFQAFVRFDDAALSYRGDLSAYTVSPFPMHIQDLATAEITPGRLRLDGSELPNGAGTDEDRLLAVLVFDVIAECTTTTVGFDLDQPFDSELSYVGDPVATNAIDTPEFPLDTTPPALDPCPDDIIRAADAGAGDGCTSAVVTYDVPGATDNCGTPLVTCDPPSGATFPVGTTLVTCTAVDDCGNETTCTFDVIVTPTNLVDIEVELPGSLPTTRCIHFVTDDCANTSDASLVFVDHDNESTTPVRAVATLEIGCGDWSMLCAKDQQHTTWATATLMLSGDGTRYETTAPIRLRAGDTDNDGDVDEFDVAYLLATFGGPEDAGGCPWDGTRGADFSNNGNVGSRDYDLLAGNWLAVTSCDCALAATGSALARGPLFVSSLAPAIAARADLNRDGLFDVRDVMLFEKRHGLAGTLSDRMRN